MTKDDYIEALLCMADTNADAYATRELGLSPDLDWDAMDVATVELQPGPNNTHNLYVARPGGYLWLRPLEYATALLAGDAEYPEWVGEDGDK